MSDVEAGAIENPSEDALRRWIGRSIEAADEISPRLVSAFESTLAPHVSSAGQEVAPAGIHWCLAPDIAAADKLGADGHPERGGFLPPVPLPRRMWAASDVEFLAPLRAGDTVKRHSTIRDVSAKNGRSGQLWFVVVEHRYENAAGLAISERQTIVYREGAVSGAGRESGGDPGWVDATSETSVSVDPVLLFRYSALTFNGHRIHYDRAYARDVEHYPDIVVHGPLQATLLLNLAASVRERPVARFSFRGVRPATGSQTMRLQARDAQDGSLDLQAVDAAGRITMAASASFAARGA